MAREHGKEYVLANKAYFDITEDRLKGFDKVAPKSEFITFGKCVRKHIPYVSRFLILSGFYAAWRLDVMPHSDYKVITYIPDNTPVVELEDDELDDGEGY